MTAESEIGVRQAHLDMLNRYCHALDTRDWTLLSHLFADDAVFEGRMILEDGSPDPSGVRIESAAAIIGALTTIWSNLSATHHMISNHVMDVAPDGRTATGSCYIRAYHVGRGEKSHLFEESLGRFDFQTVRIGSEWKIRRWDENIMIMLGTREVFGHDV
jgi:SnoaL-like domain